MILPDVPYYLTDVWKERKHSLPDVRWVWRAFSQIQYHIESKAQFLNLTIDRPAYDDIEGLYPYQSLAVHHMLNNNRFFINISPGLGKTYIGCSYISQSEDRNVIVIAPKSLHYVWQSHFEKFDILYHIDTNEYRGGITVTNVEQLYNKKFFSFPTTVICDESILYANRVSKRTEVMRKLSAHVEKMYFLSGAPYRKSLSQLWSQLNILFPNDFTSYWMFAKTFCYVSIDRYGWKIGDNKVGIEEVLTSTLQDYYYSVHIDDIKELDLPEQTEVVVSIPPTKQQLEVGTKLIKDGHYQGKILVDGPLSLITMLRQLSVDPSLLGLSIDSPKISTLIDLLDSAELPAIVISSFNSLLEYLHKTLNYKTAIFNASSDGHKRFLDGRVEILLMQYASGKFGHSFTNAKTVIYMDYTLDSDDLLQAKARTKRLTSVFPVTHYHLHCLPIDTHIYEQHQKKITSIDDLMKEITNDQGRDM